MKVLGKNLPKMGVLVIKNSPDPSTRQAKNTVPGVLGMNIIRSCYNELFGQCRPMPSHAPILKSMDRRWKQAFSECQSIDNLYDRGLA